MSTRSTRLLARCLLAVTLVAAPLGTPALAQDSKSAAMAEQLATLMAERKLDSVAIRLPSGPDEFAAALYFPGQLLVVWAKYAAPQLLNEKIARGAFRDVYIDLNSASVASTKTLVTDLGANGLRATRDDDQPFDSQDAGGKSFLFDGDWREDKLSEEEYMQTFSAADTAYSEVLTALVAGLKAGA